MVNVLLVIIGIILLFLSAERFIESVAMFAKKISISPVVIGLIIVGFGTSLPELIVSVIATLHGNLGLPIGNAVGSNITNIGLVVGATVLILPLSVQSIILKREFPLMLLVLIGIFFLFNDGLINRLDGIIMVFLMVLIILALYFLGKNNKLMQDPLIEELNREDVSITQKMSVKKGIFWLLFGIILMPISSELLVKGASGIAKNLGVSEVVIGLSVVAFGTSLPELAASIISAIKKEPDIALGNIIGSNLFNLLAVLGLPAIIHPLPVQHIVLMRDYPVMFGLSILLFLMCFGKKEHKIKRWHGFVLFALYLIYIGSLYFNIF